MFYICEDITLAHSVIHFSLYPKNVAVYELNYGYYFKFLLNGSIRLWAVRMCARIRLLPSNCK